VQEVQHMSIVPEALRRYKESLKSDLIYLAAVNPTAATSHYYRNIADTIPQVESYIRDLQLVLSQIEEAERCINNGTL
jgi:hypothetical protein